MLALRMKQIAWNQKPRSVNGNHDTLIGRALLYHWLAGQIGIGIPYCVNDLYALEAIQGLRIKSIHFRLGNRVQKLCNEAITPETRIDN